MISHLLSAILQILAFALIPFIVWMVRFKSTVKFTEFLGLKSASPRAMIYGLISCLIIAVPIFFLAFTQEEFLAILLDPESVSGQMRALGMNYETVVSIFLIAVFKTAFAEELFFRGFVAKRLISLMGYQNGNALQAVLFGIMHTLLFLSITSEPLFLFAIFVAPAAGAYVSVFINEKLADGSIYPGWLAHATANTLTYSLVAFAI